MSDLNARSRESVAAEAADWYARLRGESVSELDAARFRTWLAGDPARRSEFEAITRFWDELTAIEDAPEVLQAKESIAARRREARLHDGRSEVAPSSPHALGRQMLWAGVAAVVLAVGVFLFVEHADVNRYVTEVGEQRTVPLADGSVVTLNTATELRLHYSAAVREVELISGQANFEVAKDAARAFVVKAGNRRVRALGTVFDIYKSGDQVKVTLIEGRVAVSHVSQVGSAAEITSRDGRSIGSGVSDEVVLNAGEQLAYASGSAATQPVLADVRRATAWQSRRLDFSDTPVLEAIAEANRYSRDQIVLQAPSLAHARISGTFEAGKSELFVEGLQAYFQLDVEHLPDRRIVLTEREKKY